MALYEEIYGRPWHFMPAEILDEEEKITEFNYENYLPKELLARQDTSSDAFKEQVRMLNINTKTQMEQSDADKEEFAKLMPLLARLNENEKKSLIHLLKNEQSKRVAPG